MKFFLDNMISYRFALALRALTDQEVRALREICPQATKDPQWLKRLGQEVSVLVSGEKHIRSRPAERAALRDANITAFFLCPFWGKTTFWDQAVWIIKQWPKLESVAASVTRGTHFSVQQNGKMTPLVPV